MGSGVMRKTKKNIKKMAVMAMVGSGIIGAMLVAASVVVAMRIRLPDIADFSERPIAQSTKIYDRTGNALLYDIHADEKRTVVPFDEIPLVVKNATISIEDDAFYQHHGIRPLAILRALIANIMRQEIEQGGSTITQQLVKKTLLTGEKTISRKIKEAILAVKIERAYTKDEILNLYLNQIPYGGAVYGIEAAAQTFLQKSARELTLKEAVYLASLPKAPSYYSPCGKHRDELDRRAGFALRRMQELGFIGTEEYGTALEEEVQFKGSCFHQIAAPHFVIEVREQLNEMFGEDVVERGGFVVRTTLDASVQQSAEEAVQQFADDVKNNFNANNIGVVALEPKSGDVLAVVGSKNYFGTAEPPGCSPGKNCAFDPQVNITLRTRQPGSALKPFVYATAFKKGYAPQTAIFDLFTEFNPQCNPDGSAPPGIDADRCYHPQNYDEKFRGPVTLREALAQSLNVPSVKLLYLAGLMDSLSTARDFGITSLDDPERLGLTLVLGGGEVSLLELASAYGTFANDGIRNPHRFILEIRDSKRNIIFEAEQQQKEVIENNIARAINDILSDNDARAPAFGESSSLFIPQKSVAAKTGTTNDYRDAWIVGYTPSIVVGVWAGNNDNTPMEKRVAGFIVAPIWRNIMDRILIKTSDEEFVKPELFETPKPVLRGEWRGGKEFIIDKISGKLATEYTPLELQERKVVQEVRSILNWIDKNNPLGPPSSQPHLDPQYKNWEASVQLWANTKNFKDQDDSVIPVLLDDIHIPQTIPRAQQIEINPQKERYNQNDTITIRPVFQSTFAVAQVDYFLNDEYIGSVKTSPFTIPIPLSSFVLESETATIRLQIYDAVGNTSEYSKTIFVD